jgi:hypothetical protein
LLTVARFPPVPSAAWPNAAAIRGQTAVMPTAATIDRFCQVLREESLRRRSQPWWVSVHDVGRQLGVDHKQAHQLAAECVRRGLVKASHPGADWHIFSIHEKGRQVARKAAGLPPSS